MKTITICLALAAHVALNFAVATEKCYDCPGQGIRLRTEPLRSAFSGDGAFTGSEIDTVCYTPADERAPFIVGTGDGSLLYAIFEMTPPLGISHTEIEIRVSTDGGYSWQYFGGIWNLAHPIAHPQAFIAQNKLHIVGSLKYSVTDEDLLYASFTLSPTPAGFFSNIFDQTVLHTTRPSVLVRSDERILVAFLDYSSSRFRVSFSTNGGASFFPGTSQTYLPPAGFQRIDAAYGDPFSYFTFVSEEAGVGQVTVMRNSGETWQQIHTTSGPLHKSGPSIGAHGATWILSYQTNDSSWYTYAPADGTPVGHLLAPNSGSPAIDIAPTGAIVAVYRKNALIYRRFASIASPDFDPEQPLYTIPLTPSASDFLALHSSPIASSGVLFASEQTPDDFNIYYAHPVVPATGIQGGTGSEWTFHLDQNHPNPFNLNTVIDYSLPIEGSVILRLFNHLGQEVRTLVNELQFAGDKSVEWNSTNNAGNPVSSGVYFYQLQTGGFVQTRKLVLLR